MNPQAAQQLNPVFNQVNQGIQAQIPAIQQLYSTLIQGLQNQGSNQLQNVLASAQQRGVDNAGLGVQVQNALQGTINPIAGQLGAQEAGNVAGLQGQIGQNNIVRPNAVQNLSGALQSQNIAATNNQFKQQQLQQQAQLDMQKNQQQFNVQEAQYRANQARAAARAAEKAQSFDLGQVSESDLTRGLRLSLNGVSGKDGHVSPENLAKAYNDWVGRAGLTPESFWKNFQGKWNPDQKTYNDQFHYFVTKGI